MNITGMVCHQTQATEGGPTFTGPHAGWLFLLALTQKWLR